MRTVNIKVKPAEGPTPVGTLEGTCDDAVWSSFVDSLDSEGQGKLLLDSGVEINVQTNQSGGSTP